jgi:hypothetical protein
VTDDATASLLVRWDRIELFLHLGANRRVLVVTDSHEGDLARALVRFTSAQYTEMSPSDPKLAQLPERSMDVVFTDSAALPSTIDRVLGSDGSIVIESVGPDQASPWRSLPYCTELRRTASGSSADTTVVLQVWSRTPDRLVPGSSDDYDLGKHAAEALVRDLTRLRTERDRFASALVDAEQTLARYAQPDDPRYWRREAQTRSQRLAELAGRAKTRARETARRARARLRAR